MTKDTWRGNLFQPQSQNRYVYVMNNPLRYIDPTGHMAEEIKELLEDKIENLSEEERQELENKLEKIEQMDHEEQVEYLDDLYHNIKENNIGESILGEIF